jgi:hypothetical protein
VSGPLEDADQRLYEWSVWVRQGDGDVIGWPRATPFGRHIKPDPIAPREAIDPDRAAVTDRVIAKLPHRMQRFVKQHYLDPSPMIAKARRAHLTRDGYQLKWQRVLIIVWRHLYFACQEGRNTQTAISVSGHRSSRTPAS